MKLNAKTVGEFIKATRKALGVTQKELALSSGTGLRFIIDLEKGKPTCQIEKTFRVIHTLGIKVDFKMPSTGKDVR